MPATHACSPQSAATAVAFVTARANDDLDALWDLIEALGVDPASDAGSAIVGLTALATTAISAIAAETDSELSDLLGALGLAVAGGS